MVNRAQSKPGPTEKVCGPGTAGQTAPGFPVPPLPAALPEQLPTLRNSCRLPNEQRTRPLGCGQAILAAGIRVQMIAEVGVSGDEWGCCAPTCDVHNLWKNLLIICWGREVNGR